MTMTHTARCKALRHLVNALHAETTKVSRRSRTAGEAALNREAPVRAQLIACHIGPDAECAAAVPVMAA